MSLEFVWWCNECEKEIDFPGDHAIEYPTHSYVERMKWPEQIFIRKPLSRDIHINFGSDSKNYFRFGATQQVQPIKL